MRYRSAHALNMEQIKITERRKDFRVHFVVPLEVKAAITSINNQKVTINKCIHAHVIDLSVGGMRIRTTLEFPEQRLVTFNLMFVLMKEHFSIKGELIRKNSKNGFFEYGIRFDEMIESDRQKLVRNLNLYQISKVQNESLQKNTQQKCIINPTILKLMEAFTYPAILINSKRVIMAANKLAYLTFGTVSDQHCHSSISGSPSICTHCKLNEALTTDKHVAVQIELQRKKYLVNWLSLEVDMILHYYLPLNEQ